jgi:hypothetical protein
MENRTQSFTLKENKSIGFKNAVKNGQFRLALEYSVSIIESLEERIFELENKLNVPEDEKTQTLIEELPKAEVKKPRIIKKETEEVAS